MTTPAFLQSLTLENVAVAVVLGLLLSASCGLRAFLAPFALSFGMWMGWVSVGDSFAWMGHGAVVATFGIAIVLEVIADKFPTVDHAFDALHLVLKPLLGTLAGAALLQGPEVSPLFACVIGLCTTGALAGAAHVTKAGVRLGSTATTVGTGNPVLSVIEDIIAVALAAGLTWLAGVAL